MTQQLSREDMFHGYAAEEVGLAETASLRLDCLTISQTELSSLKRLGGKYLGPSRGHRADYGGPCPPIGRHRYRHKLYALDKKLGPLGHATNSVVEKAMAGHILAETVLTGTYQKQQRR